jgi:hypothetical protein
LNRDSGDFVRRFLDWLLVGLIVAGLAACNVSKNTKSASSSTPTPTPVAQNTPVSGSAPAGGNAYFSFTTGASNNYAIVLSNETATSSSSAPGVRQQSASSSRSNSQFAATPQRMTNRRNLATTAAGVQTPLSTTPTLSWDIFADPGFSNDLGSCTGGNCLLPLSANTTYYVRVENPGSQTVSFTMTVKISYQQGFLDQPEVLGLGQPFAATVDGSGVSFYQFTANVTANITIGLTGSNTQIGWFLFSDSGFTDPVAQCNSFTSGLDQVCQAPVTAGQTYYLLIEEFAGTNGFATLKVSDSEGSVAAPITLNVGTLHSGSVDAGGTSYYEFTIGTAGDYSISVIGTSNEPPTWARVYWDLFSDAGFSQNIGTCDNVANYSNGPLNDTCTLFLNPGTYFLATSNIAPYAGSLPQPYQILVPGSTDEGSVQAAVPLTLGTTRHATVEAYGTSYYSFTTNQTNPEKVTVGVTNSTSSSLMWFLYTDPKFTQSIPLTPPYFTSCWSGSAFAFLASTSNPSCLYILPPNTTFYLAVTEFGGSASTFDLVATGGEGTPTVPVQIAIDQRRSSVVDASASSYYTFTAGSSGQYTLGLVGHEGSGLVVPFAQLSWTLYDDAAFSHPIAVCSYTTMGSVPVCPVTLASGMAYYLKTQEFSGTQQQFDLVVGSPAQNQGSMANPYPIAWTTPNDVSTPSGVLTVGAFGQSAYSFTVVQSGPYVLSLGSDEAIDIGWSLYDQSNTLAPVTTCKNFPVPATESCVVSLTAGTTYVLAVNDYAGIPGAQLSLSLLDSGRTVFPNTPSTPQNVAFGTGGGTGMVAGGQAYFKFTTTDIAAMAYFNVSSDANVSWALYSDAGFSQLLFTCDGSHTTLGNACYTPMLAASTTYYIAVSENDGINEPFTSWLSEYGYTATPGTFNEGNAGTPIALTMGASGRPSTAGYTGSFYSFATSTPGTYHIAATAEFTNTAWYLYDDAGYTHQIAECFVDIDSAVTGFGDCFVALTGSTTYYLLVRDLSAAPAAKFPLDLTYTLSVTH